MRNSIPRFLSTGTAASRYAVMCIRKKRQAHTTSQRHLTMPSIFFGYAPKRTGATKLAVDTVAGQLEPAEPSQFRIYTLPANFNPYYSLVSSRLGHIVVVNSRPQYTSLSLASDGDFVNPAISTLPFRPQNLAFVASKDIGLSDSQTEFLEASLFTSMRYQNKTVWLRENVTRDMFIEVVSKEIPWDESQSVPARYLNPYSFKALLSTLSLTTRVCETLHELGTVGGKIDVVLDDSDVTGYKDSTDYEEDPDIPEGPAEKTEPAKFLESKAGSVDPFTKLLRTKLIYHGSSSANPKQSMAAVNSLQQPFSSFVHAGDTSSIVAHGKIFKFEPKLASPDVSIIADVIGRRFISSLGGTADEQFESLKLMKKGLGALRLTEVGDELSHLYKCIDIAIDANCGLFPFFSGSFYEGCVVMGGHGAKFIIGDTICGFEETVSLKDEFLTASTHGQSLSFISTRVPAAMKQQILGCTSMVQLRTLLLPLSITQDDRDYIIQQAGNLRFSQTNWVISPVNLKRCFLLISDLSKHLDDNCPISRVCLFSKDPILIGLSVFGEKSAPSMNTPNGTLCSVKATTPPSVPQTVQKGSGSNGHVSDAAWVMTVRKTDLMAAVEDFKVLAESQSYRSLSSVLAKKQGFYTFSRDRMAEFWMELRTAYRQANPSFLIEELEKSLKRTGKEAGVGQSAGAAPKKPRTMKF